MYIGLTSVLSYHVHVLQLQERIFKAFSSGQYFCISVNTNSHNCAKWNNYQVLIEVWFIGFLLHICRLSCCCYCLFFEECLICVILSRWSRIAYKMGEKPSLIAAGPKLQAVLARQWSGDKKSPTARGVSVHWSVLLGESSCVRPCQSLNQRPQRSH